VLKPKASGFFCTTLDLLLEYLKVTTLILTGVAGNICVHFTANDAYLRDYRLFIPSDCVASRTQRENTAALAQMRQLLGAPSHSTKVRHRLHSPVIWRPLIS
jgi:nicotinamidase-related amidase